MKSKICQNCNQEFQTKNLGTKYCSQKCKNNYKYKNHKNHIFKCKNCEKECSSYRKDIEFCTKKCSKLFLQDRQELSIEEISEYIKENPQVSLSKICREFKTSNRNLYYIMQENGYNSYKELIGTIKGVYLEKMRSDSSIASINCFNQIKDILKCDYVSEQFFDGLINKTGRRLRVDCFFEDKNLVVEYNGIQHYKFIPYFHRKENSLKEQKERDQIKANYFKNSNIKYIVIPYWFTDKDIYVETIKSQAESKLSEGLETT